jgi:PAS domain S-box-containing protein
MMTRDERYRALIETAQDLIFAVDRKGMFTYMNPAFERAAGCTASQMIGRPFTDVIAHESRAPADSHFMQGIRGANGARYEVDILRKDGGRVPVEFNVVTRFDGNHQPVGRYGIGRDITDRRLVEAALRESQEKYRLIAENMIDVISIMDMNLRFTFISPSIMRLRGFTVEEAMAQSLEQVLTPESLKFAGSLYEEEMQREASGTADPGRIQIIELQQYRKDMSVIWVESSLSFLRDADGRLMGILSLTRDITKRKRAEEALRESRELEQSILLSVPHALFGVENRRIFFANDAMEGVFGWKPEELIGKSTRVIFRNDREWEEYGGILYSQLKRQPVVIFEWDIPFVKKDGKEIFCRMSVSRTGRELGESRRIVATFEDITERRRTGEALRESQRILTDIIEFLPDATLVIDKDGRVIAWNRAMEAMTGVGKEAMIGRGDYEYALPLYGVRRPILIDLTLRPDEQMESQYTALQKTGDILFGEAYTPRLSPGNVHLSATASVLRDTHGAIVGAIQCIRNNTERRALEERLAQARKMEALGLLAGGVAHDLNNVLGVLVGYSELMLHDMDKDSRFRKHAESILTAGERAATIVQDMLDLARRGIHTATVVDLNRTVRDYLHSPEYGNLCSYHRRCRIKTKLEDLLLHIKGSPAHLGKVLANLVSNAAESMPEGGEVMIRTRNRYLDGPVRGYDDVNAGDYVVLSVADTGQGISEEDMRRIFEPFYTKKVMGRSGTGLGLAVVWGTVKDHEGYIDVESRPGEGTIFSLYFPVTRDELQQDAPVPVAAFMGRGESILVVDDVKEQRELAAQMLGRLDYRVTSVSSGEKAVDYLKTNRPDLVVLDMIMDPGMDGLDTYRKVVALHPRQKAIIVSGYAETDRVREAQKLGAGAYVRKPYILERLGMAVRKELDRQERA